MTHQKIYNYTSNIIKIIKNLTLPEHHSKYNYNSALNEISTVLSLCYTQLENIYYSYILRPNLLKYNN